MEFLHSEEADPRTYETDGLDFGVKLRISKYYDKEKDGILRVQRDWSNNVHPLHQYYGGFLERYSFITANIPECEPERMEIVSYVNEYFFLYDDEMEKLKPKGSMGKEDAHDILQDFGDEVLTNKFDSNTPPATRMQAQFLSEMMEIDAPRAITSFKAWAKFVRQASKIKRDEIKTLKEYMPSRITDAGELILFAAITFGMKLTIPEEELDILMELIKPANAATCLVNDVYSWDKECKEVEMQGSTTLFNAIPIIMNERDVSEAEAIRICREEIEKNFRHFMCTIEKEKKEATLSKDVLTYLDAIMYMYIGNLVWSIACPRYNA